jgi:hypothetical protein
MGLIPGGKEAAVTSKNAWTYLFTVALVFLGFAFAFINSALLIHESVRNNDTSIIIYASITMMVFLLLLILVIVDMWKRRQFVSTLKKSLFKTVVKKNKNVLQSSDVSLYQEVPKQNQQRNRYSDLADAVHGNAGTDDFVYNRDVDVTSAGAIDFGAPRVPNGATSSAAANDVGNIFADDLF